MGKQQARPKKKAAQRAAAAAARADAAAARRPSGPWYQGRWARVAAYAALAAVGADVARVARERPQSLPGRATSRLLASVARVSEVASRAFDAADGALAEAGVRPLVRQALEKYHELTSSYLGALLVLLCGLGAIMLRDVLQYRRSTMKSKFKARLEASKSSKELLQAARRRGLSGDAVDEWAQNKAGRRGIRAYFDDDDEWDELDGATGFDAVYQDILDKRAQRRKGGAKEPPKEGGQAGAQQSRAGGKSDGDDAAQ